MSRAGSRGIGAGLWVLLVAVLGAAIGAGNGCASRRETIEIEVEDTITTVETGNTTTTGRRGPAPGWERRGDP